MSALDAFLTVLYHVQMHSAQAACGGCGFQYHFFYCLAPLLITLHAAMVHELESLLLIQPLPFPDPHQAFGLLSAQSPPLPLGDLASPIL